jgi:transcriptional regulator with XRE-family HTH domain
LDLAYRVAAPRSGQPQLLPPPRLVTAARILVHLSQSELAKQAGVNVATLGRYERGETNAQIDTLDAILRALRAHGIHFIAERPIRSPWDSC